MLDDAAAIDAQKGRGRGLSDPQRTLLSDGGSHHRGIEMHLRPLLDSVIDNRRGDDIDTGGRRLGILGPLNAVDRGTRHNEQLGAYRPGVHPEAFLGVVHAPHRVPGAQHDVAALLNNRDAARGSAVG
jgi:hypothetical protein